MVTPPPPVSRHSSTVRIRLSASVRTPKPTPPMITPTPGEAGRTILHRFVVKPTGLDRSAGLQRRIDLPNDIQRAARFGRSDRGPASRRGTEHRHCYIDVTCPVALQLVDQLLLLGDVLFGLRDMVIRLGWMLMTIGHRRFSLPNPRPRAFTAGPWGYSIESSDGTERGKDRGENSAIRRPSDAGYGIAAGTGKR
jgi:hypothetical protein